LFDVGKIVSVEPGISNKSATIKVYYSENNGKCKVKLCLDDYVTFVGELEIFWNKIAI
jgi:hypothetical protein